MDFLFSDCKILRNEYSSAVLNCTQKEKLHIFSVKIGKEAILQLQCFVLRKDTTPRYLWKVNFELLSALAWNLLCVRITFASCKVVQSSFGTQEKVIETRNFFVSREEDAQKVSLKGCASATLPRVQDLLPHMKNNQGF